MKKDKQRKRTEQEEKKSASEYYRLNTQAVKDLVEADVSNSPKVSREELNKYRSGLHMSVAGWVKLLFIKFWFPGSVCFFFFWGLSPYVADLLDMLVILGLALGVVTDLLTNNVLRFFAEKKGDNDRWMMIPEKSFSTLFLNILYAFVLLFFVFTLYNFINGVIVSFTGEVEQVPLGVEPILFGLFYLGFDMLCIWMKHTFTRIIEDAKAAAGAHQKKQG